MKNRILIFNGYYLPARNYGGPLTSIRNFVNTCKNKYDIYIISYNHDVGEKTIFNGILEGWQTIEYANVKYVSNTELAYNRRNVKKIIDEVKPDVVWVSGIFWPDILLPLNAVCKNNVPIVLSPRGEVSADRICIKGYKKYPYVFLTRLIGLYKDAWAHGTSEDEIVGIKKFLGISNEKTFLVPNIGVPNKELKSKRKEVGSLRIVFISRIHLVKNLKLAVEVVAKLNDKATFDVYGPLEQPDYWNQCMEIAKKNNSEQRIRYCGQLEPDQVGDTFSKYDCFLFPTLNENYGHAIAEALANKCPVVISKGTTPWDDLNGKAGFVCDIENKMDFINSLENIQNMGEDEYDNLLKSVDKYYNNKLQEEGAIKGHCEMFDTVINKK